MGMPKRVGVTYSNPKKIHPYIQALRTADVDYLLIDPNTSLDIGTLDGLLLTGGTDVNPSLYHQDRHPETEDPDDARDSMEKQLLESALERDLPILAICRGLQILNVVHGGTLLQHVEGHRYPGVADAHPISVEPGATLARAIGLGSHRVNSRHHQAVDKVGASLRVSAKSPDGCIEALERMDKDFVLAVQWHPEDLVANHDAARGLFQAFAKAL
jgi:putative glutamine amidotransferase